MNEGVTRAGLKALAVALRADPNDRMAHTTLADWYEENGEGVKAWAHRALAEGECGFYDDKRQFHRSSARWDLYLPREWVLLTDEELVTNPRCGKTEVILSGLSLEGNYRKVVEAWPGCVRCVYQNRLAARRGLYKMVDYHQGATARLAKWVASMAISTGG